MQVATAQEALFMACEMESSAIQLYTRALSLMEQLGRQDEPLYDHLTLMLADEQEHLAQFRALGGRDDLAQERRVALSAAADNILFEGGLMGAARAGLSASILYQILPYIPSNAGRRSQNPAGPPSTAIWPPDCAGTRSAAAWRTAGSAA